MGDRALLGRNAEDEVGSARGIAEEDNDDLFQYLKLVVAYDGTRFDGFQRQNSTNQCDGQRIVQEWMPALGASWKVRTLRTLFKNAWNASFWNGAMMK
jgi:hypothetical protein